jgi:nucleoside-diphosphate-sugar epimerase
VSVSFDSFVVESSAMSKTILVTGANSFIGIWIVKYLLEKGYNVRGTVRSKAKESQVLIAIPSDQHSRVSFVHVADITTDSFDEAVQGVDGIIHVASPFHFKVTDPEKDLLLPAINGTTGVLRAAHEYNKNNQGQIKRIVITSSFASVVDANYGLRPGYVYTEKDWCPLTYEQGAAAKNDPVLVYRASKVCAERAAWDFIEKEKPAFTIATICEPLVFGPRADGFKTMDDMNTSNGNIWSLLTSGKDAAMPEPRVPSEVDVRDVAYTHVAALERMVDTNERYLIAAGSWSHQEIADIVHASETIPEQIKNTTPVGTKGKSLPEHFQIDSSKAEKELGVTFIPLKKTVEDIALQFVKLQDTLKQA